MHACKPLFVRTVEWSCLVTAGEFVSVRGGGILRMVHLCCLIVLDVYVLRRLLLPYCTQVGSFVCWVSMTGCVDILASLVRLIQASSDCQVLLHEISSIFRFTRLKAYDETRHNHEESQIISLHPSFPIIKMEALSGRMQR